MCESVLVFESLGLKSTKDDEERRCL